MPNCLLTLVLNYTKRRQRQSCLKMRRGAHHSTLNQVFSFGQHETPARPPLWTGFRLMGEHRFPP
jgi:hypothetical protein